MEEEERTSLAFDENSVCKEWKSWSTFIISFQFFCLGYYF